MKTPVKLDAEVTVRVVEPEMLPCVAEIVVDCPDVTLVARPAALIVATLVLDEAHATDPLMSCVVLSEKAPVAVNCSVWPIATDGFVGVTAIVTRVGAVPAAAVTVSVTEALIEPEEA